MFEDDAVGRQRFVYLAMEGKEAELRAIIQEISQRPRGGRHIARALNNLKSIGHAASHLFAKLCYEALLPEWPIEVQINKCLHLLSIVSPQFSMSLGFLQERSLELLHSLSSKPTEYFVLWQALCACIFRSNGDTDALIRGLGPMREIQMTRRQLEGIKTTLRDERVDWALRASNVYFLLGNRVITLEEVMRFLDAAYLSFPLEAMGGIEALSIATEMDASEFVEFELIEDKLAQVRRDGMILREVDRSSFEQGSKLFFSSQSRWPKDALVLVRQLDNLERVQRMLMTTLIDDSRRNDFFALAKRYICLKPLSLVFFSHFEPENPLSLGYSRDFVTQLLENENASAREAEAWFEAIDANDLLALGRLLTYWCSDS